MQLTILARRAGQTEILARLEQRRLQRAQVLRQSCTEAHLSAVRRAEAAAEALASHMAQRDQILRTAYDGIARRRVTAAMLHVVRGQEDQLRRAQDALAAEQEAAAASLQATQAALAEAQAALLQAIRRSTRRDRLASELATRWARALDDAEEARRADDVDDRARPGRAA